MKITKVIILIMLVFLISGCAARDSKQIEDEANTGQDNEVDYDISKDIQFAPPTAGDIIANIHVRDYGVIRVKLFPEIAPRAVYNFTTLSKHGYYNGVSFHTVIEDLIIQSGDPTNTGAGGISMWGNYFVDEFSYDLLPLRGALAMYNLGQADTNGSQFFIVQSSDVSEDIVNQMIEYQWPESEINKYKQFGGAIGLFGRYTVFGQVFEGLEIIDAIASVEVDENQRPLEDIIIEYIEIEGDIEDMNINQFAQPEKGDIVAEMHIRDYGVIKIKFFPEESPKTVENFLTHARNGYYDGLIFHRVMNDFMIQGGDPTGTGMGGESIWGGKFEDEFSRQLFPYRGSLAMANAGPDTNGSQFFIVQLGDVSADFVSQMESLKMPEELINNYKEHGGTPWLYGRHTVFGQVFEGMDVVDAIAATRVDGNSRPFEEVVIERINVIEY